MQYRTENTVDYFSKKKIEIDKMKKVALERKDAAKSALINMVFKANELAKAIESPSLADGAKKAPPGCSKDGGAYDGLKWIGGIRKLALSMKKARPSTTT